MKLVYLVSASFLWAAALAASPKCTFPEYEYAEPIYAKGKVIDLNTIQAKIDKINQSIIDNNPKLSEKDILNLDEIKTKFGDKLVEKIKADAKVIISKAQAKKAEKLAKKEAEKAKLAQN